MSKITVGLGLTIPVSEESRTFVRPEVRIADIDTDGDVQAQLKEAGEAIVQVWDEASNRVYEKVTDLISQKNPEVKETIENALGAIQEKIDLVQEVLGEHLREHAAEPEATKGETSNTVSDEKAISDDTKMEEPVDDADDRKKFEKEFFTDDNTPIQMVDVSPQVQENIPEGKEEKKKPKAKPKKKDDPKKEEKTKKKFICKVCGSEYDEWKDAYNCRKSHEESGGTGVSL